MMNESYSRTVSYRAFTLTELLFVVLIIIVLASLLIPVLSSSIKKGKTTDDLTKLKNIGYASSLYQSDYDNKHPGNFIPLVIANYIGQDMFASTRDKTQLGLGNVIYNQYLEQINNSHSGVKIQDRSANFKLSFASYHEYYVNEELQGAIRQCQGGWAIDPLDMLPDDAFGRYDLPSGNYRLLMLDTSVLPRTVKKHDSGSGKVFTPAMLFADECDGVNQWLQQHM